MNRFNQSLTALAIAASAVLSSSAYADNVNVKLPVNFVNCNHEEVNILYTGYNFNVNTDKSGMANGEIHLGAANDDGPSSTRINLNQSLLENDKKSFIHFLFTSPVTGPAAIEFARSEGSSDPTITVREGNIKHTYTPTMTHIYIDCE